MRQSNFVLFLIWYTIVSVFWQKFLQILILRRQKNAFDTIHSWRKTDFYYDCLSRTVNRTEYNITTDKFYKRREFSDLSVGGFSINFEAETNDETFFCNRFLLRSSCAYVCLGANTFYPLSNARESWATSAKSNYRVEKKGGLTISRLFDSANLFITLITHNSALPREANW